MSVGTIGTIRPSDVSVQDIDIFYNYIPNRETSNNDIYRLDAEELLSYTYLPDDEQISGIDNILEGLYNLRLPAATFNQLGIYTLYIKPKSLILSVMDCSVLSSLPTVKGIVVDEAELPTNLRSNNALQGYRVEYVNSDGTKMRNTVRYVVTSNKVVPITENIGNTNQTATRYKFDDGGTLLFLQVTPSSSSNVKANSLPFIGNPGQTIIISNTFFTPLTIEIDLVENTIDTLTDLVAGEQIKNVQNGMLTYYDKDRVITKQFNLFEIKDDVSDVPLYEVKEKRGTIDSSQDFNSVISEIE